MSRLDKISIADTARWVAYYRAMESERPDALFHDPYARALAGPRGQEIVSKMRGGVALAVPNIIRSAVMDELITESIAERGVDFVINLAAGLDARPYRMELPPNLLWIEVDYPETIAYKTAKLATAVPRCRLERIGADLADAQARRSLFDALNARGAKGLVLTEGLMAYLTPEQAGNVAADLAREPSFRYWMTDIIAPMALRMVRRRLSRVMDAKTAIYQFAPAEGADFYARFGWSLVTYRSMLVDMRRFRREPRGMWFWLLLMPRFARAEPTRRHGPMTGTILMERVCE